jgi:hypothetical protein
MKTDYFFNIAGCSLRAGELDTDVCISNRLGRDLGSGSEVRYEIDSRSNRMTVLLGDLFHFPSHLAIADKSDLH